MPDEYPHPDQVFIASRVLIQLAEKLDHIHDDLVALRAASGIPRPECYPRPDTTQE